MYARDETTPFDLQHGVFLWLRGFAVCDLRPSCPTDQKRVTILTCHDSHCRKTRHIGQGRESEPLEPIATIEGSNGTRLDRVTL